MRRFHAYWLTDIGKQALAGTGIGTPTVGGNGSVVMHGVRRIAMWTQSSMVIAVRWMRVEWSQWGTWMEWATTATRSQMVGQCATVTVGTKRV